MKKLFVIVLLSCIYGLGAHAQTSNETRTNREKRKTERLIKRAERQEKKLNKKTKTSQEDETVIIEQVDNTINETYSDNFEESIPKNTSNSDLPNIESVSSQKKSKTNTPSQNKVIDKKEYTNSDYTTSNDSNFVVFFIIIAVIIAIPITIFKWLFSGRCKKCGKLWAMRTIDEQYLGCSKTKMEKDDQGKLYQVHYNKIKVIQCCKSCGYTSTHIEERKG